MAQWVKWWALVRDVLLTGTGMAVIIIQVFSAHPSTPLLWTGLGLTAPAAVEHVKALLPGSGPPDSSPASPPPGSQHSSEQQEASTGE
jgi:hypothetical protein